MKTRFGHIISAFLILAFATAGISPACEFVNGGTALIEICKADGTIETIEVPADQAPFDLADADQPTNHEHDHAEKSDCMFCFSWAKKKAANSPASQIIAATPSHYLSNTGGLITPKALTLNAYNPTGPPSLIS